MSEPSAAARAREWFRKWIDDAGDHGRDFLQLRIRRTPDGTYEIRHIADRDEPLRTLSASSDPEAALRIAHLTAEGRYRPLRTQPDLRRGWVLAGVDEAGLWHAVSRLYPAAAIHRHQWETGELPVVPFRVAAARQTGIYAGLEDLPEESVDAGRRACCTTLCLRTVAWPVEGAPRQAGGPAPADDFVPCREPCSLLFSFFREVVVPESERPAHVEGPPESRAEIAEEIRGLAALTARAGAEAPETGDFAHPLNPRRLLLLAEQIEEG